MDFAAEYLRIGGHVSYWYPILRETVCPLYQFLYNQYLVFYGLFASKRLS